MNIARRCTGKLRDHLDRANRWLAILCWTAAALVSAFQTFAIAATGKLGWDGRFVWQVKTCLIAGTGTPFPPHEYYTDPSAGMIPVQPGDLSTAVSSHVEYPLLLPWLQLLLGGCGGAAPQRADALAALALIFVAGVTGWRIGQHVGPVTMILFAFAAPLANVGMLGQGYADVLVAALFMLAVALGLGWRQEQTHGRLLALTLSLVALVWSKQEGAILALVLLSLLAWAVRSRARPLLLAGLPALLVVLTWQVFLRIQGAAVGGDFSPTIHLDRLLPIVGFTASLLLAPFHFGILCAAVAPGYYALWRVDRRAATVLLGSVVIPIGTYTTLYVLSSWADWHEHMRMSLPRLLFHTVGPLVILSATGWLTLIRSFARCISMRTMRQKPTPSATTN